MQRNFLRGLLICLIPTALFGAAALFGTYRKGIDLAGGTILVYEVDLTKSKAGPGPRDPATAGDEDIRRHWEARSRSAKSELSF